MANCTVPWPALPPLNSLYVATAIPDAWLKVEGSSTSVINAAFFFKLSHSNIPATATSALLSSVSKASSP